MIILPSPPSLEFISSSSPLLEFVSSLKVVPRFGLNFSVEESMKDSVKLVLSITGDDVVSLTTCGVESLFEVMAATATPDYSTSESCFSSKNINEQ
ncbi:hypothetical protein SNEBB_008411 [Seison nebaliae]|nr:hypothetical protein SNEBB_008411 [Seison nebaliae]